MIEIDEKKRTVYERKRNAAARLREKAKLLDYEARKAKRIEDRQIKCSIGGLADIAGLLYDDKAMILGGLLYIAKTDNYQKQKWKEEGHRLLLERKEKRNLERKEKREKEWSEQNERNDETDTGDVPD